MRVAAELVAQAPPSRTLTADAAYDSNGFRQWLASRGTLPVIANNPRRLRPCPLDQPAYGRRNIIERSFCRLKDFRRIATRYDKLAATFDAAVCLAALILWWL